MTSDKKYLPNLDFLRVVAAYFVLLFHFNWEGNDPLSKVFSYGYIGVYVFFCISGFISPLAMQWSGYRLRDWKSFLISRFFRLYPAFAVIALFEIFLYANGSFMGYGYKFDQFTWFQIVTNFTWTAEFFEENWLLPVFWTLAIEAQFIIAILLIYPLFKHKNEWIRVSPVIALITVNYFVGKGNTLFSYSAIFGMGMLAYLYYVRKIRIGTLLLLLILACFSYTYGVSGIHAITALLTVLFILFIPQLRFKFIPYFGKFAYSFFLIHITFGGATCFYLRFLPEQWYFQLIKVFSASIVSFYAAWFFYHKVESPCHVYSRKLKKRKPHVNK